MKLNWYQINTISVTAIANGLTWTKSLLVTVWIYGQFDYLFGFENVEVANKIAGIPSTRIIINYGLRNIYNIMPHTDCLVDVFPYGQLSAIRPCPSTAGAAAPFDGVNKVNITRGWVNVCCKAADVILRRDVRDNC